MTVTLIVLAHPETRSFNGAWAKATKQASLDLGHEVLWSDLCSMGFDPVEAKSHYSDFPNDAQFDPLKAQEAAARSLALPADVAAEVSKIRRAHRIIFHFPIWWFGPPAILKGWMDRALPHGELHTVDSRFDQGMCRGKKAMFCVTTGASAAESDYCGKEGDIQMLLWPLAYTMRYLGFTVLKPITAHGIHGYYEGTAETALQLRLRALLTKQKQVIDRFDALPTMSFNADSDFDEDGRLEPKTPSYSHFIRHEP